MRDIAIKTDSLSKQYHIGIRHNGYRTLRDTLTDAFVAPFRRARRLFRGQPYGAADMSATIWALKDVSFEIKRGEVVGIIGSNGAGKTTLLKILSRITEPTEGYAEIYGRVGSLLEVGTGFHPELTGRENIYLNGAILGMRKAEIVSKFDEIVDFAEIEQFIDTPVKYYSSGMYVRLAFAVAARLEPEILLVDEVLAVGDAAFQRKCLGKMGDMAQEGRTVLFVSHNMDAIVRLCNSAIYLKSGEVLSYGRAASIVESYISNSFDANLRSVIEFEPDKSNRKLVFTRVALIPNNDDGKQGLILECHIDYQVSVDKLGAVAAVRIDSASGTPIMTLTDSDMDEERFIKKRGSYRAICPIPISFLAPGTYRVTISAADMKGTRHDFYEGVLTFNVEQSSQIKPAFRREGPLLVPVDWEIQEIPCT